MCRLSFGNAKKYTLWYSTPVPSIYHSVPSILAGTYAATTAAAAAVDRMAHIQLALTLME